jgi:magnesium transporter
MIYLTRMLGKPVVDAAGETIGAISDIAITSGEVFPRVTSLAFLGPDKTPFMLSWRKFVAEFDGERVVLNAPGADLRFSYLQPDEILLHRDLLNKQIVDTQGMKVVRVNDLKLSESRGQMRLLGAEVGLRGLLRGIGAPLERAADAVAKLFGAKVPEDLIAWNYIDLLERDLSHVKLSVTHKRLHELHPADVADVLEQLTPAQRAKVFEHLDNDQAAEAISELEDELQADVIEDLDSERAADVLEIMDPDDAADIVGDLPYDKAEALLRLMGVKEARQVRKLLGYKEKTAGGIMTPEVTTVSVDMTAEQVIEHLRTAAAENESIYYIYVVGPRRALEGVVSLRDLLVAQPGTRISDILERELFTVGPDDDQEQVAELMSKYDLLAMPVVDEAGRLLGMVTVDDALDVLEQEAEEDVAIATGRSRGEQIAGAWLWISRSGWLAVWAVLFLAGAAIARIAPTDPVLSTLALGVVFFSPIVLRVAEDVASHVMARVIGSEADEQQPPFLRRLVGDAAMGLVLGLAVGLVWFGTQVLMSPPDALDSLAYQSYGMFGAAFAVSVIALTLAGTVMGWLAARRSDAGKRPSQVAVSVALMVFGEIVFVTLFLLANDYMSRLMGG